MSSLAPRIRATRRARRADLAVTWLGQDDVGGDQILNDMLEDACYRAGELAVAGAEREGGRGAAASRQRSCRGSLRSRPDDGRAGDARSGSVFVSSASVFCTTRQPLHGMNMACDGQCDHRPRGPRAVPQTLRATPPPPALSSRLAAHPSRRDCPPPQAFSMRRPSTQAPHAAAFAVFRISATRPCRSGRG